MGMSTLVEHAAPREKVLPKLEGYTNRGCDCGHEELTDGIHHYLQLPSIAERDGFTPKFNESISQTSEPYIGVAMTEPKGCFMAPKWIGFFTGDSELGEIAPATRLLCAWCKNHWSKAPSATFERLN